MRSPCEFWIDEYTSAHAPGGPVDRSPVEYGDALTKLVEMANEIFTQMIKDYPDEFDTKS